MNVVVYVVEDTIVVFRREIYAGPHQHHALQITMGIGDQFGAVVDGNVFWCKGLVINNDQLHQVLGQAEWVVSLLINPESPFAKAVQGQLLMGESHQTFDFAVDDVIGELVDKSLSCEQVQVMNGKIREALAISSDVEYSIDPRIAEAIEMIRRLPEKQIAMKDLSRHVHLSESRFGHLFREEIGIPLRRYLLWQRLLMALETIACGENFTFAAHETGFTDSAHLGRTFYRMFGIRLSDMFAHRDLIRVMQCERV
jgi:AraC-like DNA-binding protein